MALLHRWAGELVRRDLESSKGHTMLELVVALLVLVVVSLSLTAGLIWMRYRRRRALRMEELPEYKDERRTSIMSTTSTHRRIMIRPSESVYLCREKKRTTGGADSPPLSPLPEIRITFPEEMDECGKRVSGRVVVVRVGETTVGLEPFDEKLPAYEEEGERMYSLDLERIGGLEEKSYNDASSWH